MPPHLPLHAAGMSGFRATLQSRPVVLARALAAEWTRVDGTHLAAALAFYSVLSLTPFLLVVIAITTWMLGSNATTHYLMEQIADVAGAATAQFVRGLVQDAHPAAPREGVKALIGLAVTLAGATATFTELEHGLDRIFGERVQSAFGLVRARLLAFGLVVAVAFLSMISLFVSAGVNAMLARVPHADLLGATLGALANEAVSFVVLAVAFYAILRVLPLCPPTRRAARIGALASTTLFVFGKFLIGWYLARFALASAYGAAGAIVVVMLWIYWSSALFFAGAVVARVVDRRDADRRDADRSAEPGLSPAGLA